METFVKRHRGRPRKEKKTLEEMEDEVILKWLNFEPMTFEEAALALWMHEGRKTPKPLSKPRLIAIEAGAMQKIREKFKKLGITQLDDIYDPRYRSNANCNDRVDGDGE